jgi:hypothetical protein
MTGSALDVVMTTGHPVARCVDLRATFGARFKYAWDPAYVVERSEFRRVEAPWLTRIACRFGFIAPYGGRRLLAHATSRRRALMALGCVTVVQQATDEVAVTLDVADVEAVAVVLGARKVRTASPAAVERLRRFRFRPRSEQLFGSRNDDLAPG